MRIFINIFDIDNLRNCKTQLVPVNFFEIRLRFKSIDV
jgi:hypothetical protein